MPRIRQQSSLDAEMRKLFDAFHVEAVSKLVSPHPSKYAEPGDHYYCFVDLPTVWQAAAAVAELNNKDNAYGGRYKIRTARFDRPITVEREQLGVEGSGPYADNRRATSPPLQRDFTKSWRRQN